VDLDLRMCVQIEPLYTSFRRRRNSDMFFHVCQHTVSRFSIKISAMSTRLSRTMESLHEMQSVEIWVTLTRHGWR
jgi:hypothetical protein